MSNKCANVKFALTARIVGMIEAIGACIEAT